jgi:hypothetical protein
MIRSYPEDPVSPSITIHVSGSLLEGHLSYLDQLVTSAIECGLWPLLNMTSVEKLDRDALGYLINGEGRYFGIVACPTFVREQMQIERGRCAA